MNVRITIVNVCRMCVLRLCWRTWNVRVQRSVCWTVRGLLLMMLHILLKITLTTTQNTMTGCAALEVATTLS